MRPTDSFTDSIQEARDAINLLRYYIAQGRHRGVIADIKKMVESPDFDELCQYAHAEEEFRGELFLRHVFLHEIEEAERGFKVHGGWTPGKTRPPSPFKGVPNHLRGRKGAK